MDRVRTVATFIAGVLVGGSAVYFSPPAGGAANGSPSAMSGGPLMPPLPDGQMPAQGAGGQPGMGQPGMGQAGMVPGGMGTNGALPADGALAGSPVPGTVPGQAGAAVSNLPPSNLPPADGAAGPPPDDVPAAPAGAVQTSGSRLEKHLRVASVVWSAQADLAKASSKEAVRALATDIGAHAQGVPEIVEHMPPMQEVAGYLASSRVLLDRMQAAGMDVAELSLQIDMMMRPPRGKIPGGPKAGGAPQ
ncbi:MAG: hypothetical protein V4850_21190 [Myxococcota bacterium]